MTNPERPLTARQQAFVQEYPKDLNATQAAIRAGYAAKTANREGARLLSNAVIASRIAVAREARAEQAGVDAQTVLEGLLKEAKGSGPDTASSARIAAWKLIGQHVGMWGEKEENNRAVKVVMNFKPLSPEEIEEIRDAPDDD